MLRTTYLHTEYELKQVGFFLERSLDRRCDMLYRELSALPWYTTCLALVETVITVSIIPLGSMLCDCDDDGETKAGARLLELLTILDVCDIVVVVTRWYGGSKLGADRFKHINNAARNVLDQHGVLKSPKGKS